MWGLDQQSLVIQTLNFLEDFEVENKCIILMGIYLDTFWVIFLSSNFVNGSEWSRGMYVGDGYDRCLE